MSRITLNYPLFDGEKVIENASVVSENGKIISVDEAENTDKRCFLMPALIDAHTHITSACQTHTMLKNGIAAACDVSATESIIENAAPFTIISSAGMTMGTMNGKAYVKKMLDGGARYIKVFLFEPNLMLKSVLKDICNAAHDSGIKVAVHATSVKSVRMAVECGADILLHVPMKEEYPRELAEAIAKRGIVSAPTLVMMEAFAKNSRSGYKPVDYRNAENAVKLLHECGVKILTATDANDGSFVPAVAYGTSIHREMQLLERAGMTPTEVLASATSRVAEVFGISYIGMITVGKRANLLLIEGRPDENITYTTKIRQVWVDGKPVL